MRKAIFLLVPLVILGGLVYRRLSEVKTQKAQEAGRTAQRRNQSPPVDVATAGPREIARTLEVVGTLESSETARISPRSALRITEVLVREGDRVTRGRPLVRLDASELEGAVTQARAAVAEARARYAEARLTADAKDIELASAVRQQRSAVDAARADATSVRRTYEVNVATADQAVADAQARVEAARTAISDATAATAAAKATLANVSTRAERTRRLFDQGFIAAQDVDDARALIAVEQGNVAAASARIASAQSALASAQAVLRSAQATAAAARRRGVADVAAANARIESARALAATAAANRAQGPAYRENLAALQAAVAAAEGGLRQAEDRAAENTLVSPIEGVVTARGADPGTVASTTEPVLTIQNVRFLFVNAAVPVEESDGVKIGDPVKVVLDGDRTVDGRIAEINPAADPLSRRFTARIRLDNADGSLRPGAYARVTITVERVVVPVAVPREAVRTTRGQTTVSVVDAEGQATTRDVKTGRTDAGYTEIVSGLKAGERIVKLSYSPVKDGAKVRAGGKSEVGSRDSARSGASDSAYRESRTPNSSSPPNRESPISTSPAGGGPR